MKNILCFGDSNTWGFIPESITESHPRRHPHDVRWTGMLARELGEGFKVIEEGQNGRTTVHDDPFALVRNAKAVLPAILESHKPLDLVVLMLGTSAGIAYQLGHLRLTDASRRAYIESVSERLAAILRPGLKDHIHCAIHRGIPKTPNSLAQSVQELGPEYKGLIPVVQKAAPRGFVLSTGHQCRYQGRQFVHLALTNGSQVLSLVIAGKTPGESFTAGVAAPALSEAGTPFYAASAQKYAISAFETDRHLIYTVSDLPAAENMRVMVALAPGVRGVLTPSL